MGSRADQEYFFGGHRVDQEPVRPDVAFPNAAPFAGQSVCGIGRWESALFCKQFDSGKKLLNIFTSALLAFEISAKLLSLRNAAHSASQSARISFAQSPRLSKPSIFLRRRAPWSAFRVAAFGIRTG